MAPNETEKRTIRSFVRRGGRITPSQQKALETHWPRYGIEYSTSPLKLPGLLWEALRG